LPSYHRAQIYYDLEKINVIDGVVMLVIVFKQYSNHLTILKSPHLSFISICLTILPMVETRQSSKRMSTPPWLMSLPKRGKGSKKSTTLDAPDSDATKPLTASVQQEQDRCRELYSDEQKKDADEIKKSRDEQLELEQIKRNIAFLQAKVKELKRLIEDMDTP
jgi:anti-sigma28 factor (negative regulator of flagellin synthesis)